MVFALRAVISLRDHRPSVRSFHCLAGHAIINDGPDGRTDGAVETDCMTNGRGRRRYINEDETMSFCK